MSQSANEAHEFVEQWKTNVALLQQSGVYRPEDEHSNCGVGLVAAIDGKPSRQVVEAGIGALKVLFHRGAVDADGKTGDGAGVLLQIPRDFFREKIELAGSRIEEQDPLAVGMVFLPRTDFAAQETCRTIVESTIIKHGYRLLGWRQVPVNVSVIGDKANVTRPEIEQVMITTNKGLSRSPSTDDFERDLYLIRRTIEKKVLRESINDFYICSLSCRHLVFKGLFLAEQLSAFYPDLLDERFRSSFIIYHQRYSTNTFPRWSLAQPFRTLAHNGEINTLRGNINWMRVHEVRMASELFAKNPGAIKPIIQPGCSDSGALDQVFELIVRAGRDAPLAKSMLIPEAWSKNLEMSDAERAFYRYCDALMKPWDGPAAITATDGRWLVAGMDRNGLRPMRYALTTGGLLVVGSETGMVHLKAEEVRERGRVGPGQMVAVDLQEGKFYRDHEIKHRLVHEKPYAKWTGKSRCFTETLSAPLDVRAQYTDAELAERQLLAGYTRETLELILQPMATTAKEPIGSMGDDTPIAVLSQHYRGLHHYFRQNFSQVTNPPIDPLREHRVMNLTTRFGNLVNVLDEECLVDEVIELDSPVLLNHEYKNMLSYMGKRVKILDCTFVPGDGHRLEEALNRIRDEAEAAVRQNFDQLVLSDENLSPGRAPIPMILATAGVHGRLVDRELRSYCSINLHSSEALDVHCFAVLIGVGATTINPYLAEESLISLHKNGRLGDLDLANSVQNYREAVNAGLLKIMSKMGISMISSYRAGYNFEALGLSRTLVNEFFPGMPSRISGIGLSGLERKIAGLLAKRQSLDETLPTQILPIGGLYRYRAEGETHALSGNYIHQLQNAIEQKSFARFKQASQIIYQMPPVSVRDLLTFRSIHNPIPIDEVDSIHSIRRNFVTPGMSLGALSAEAHGTLNVAMNRIGAKSVSGEGGEDPQRYSPQPNGDNANSAVKQIASGRFGVTAEYLNQCEEIEIKIAQGAKPGEGGQLPGFKVTAEIAALRHSTPGVTLISPPPHHDIYSIEDLAQLIYDLKQINPRARVAVKLVSRSGIGTIAAGVAKANADVIHISGHSGGTGASPKSSILHAGLPWELGLSEAHQILVLNRLRHRVKLRVDGGIKTGRDIIMAAILGAEEFAIGTASLVAMGCLLVRQCQSNTCPVGICTQKPELREKFMGTPEKVIQLFSFLAEEVRRILSELGYRSLHDIVGRTELLMQVNRVSEWFDDLDLNPLLVQADAGNQPITCTVEGRNEVPETLDAEIIRDAQPFFERGEKMELAYTVRNTHRSIGARTSSLVLKAFPGHAFQEDHLSILLRGSAGQSLGAFLVPGIKILLKGDANDYVGKGLSGGTIVISPYTSSLFQGHKNTIIGNTVLYGATSGRLFAAGQAGERFAVRNSGATAVIEGCGANGCEYMTGGTVVILGEVGDNFAAGMTGGMAFIYDPQDTLPLRLNRETVVMERVESRYWETLVHDLIVDHHAQTGSAFAEIILQDWLRARHLFWQVCPKEMLTRLAHPLK